LVRLIHGVDGFSVAHVQGGEDIPGGLVPRGQNFSNERPDVIFSVDIHGVFKVRFATARASYYDESLKNK